MGALRVVFIVMIVSLAIAFFWDSIPAVKEIIHSILDPSAGALLNKNINFGMIIVAAVISFAMTLIQKYTIDNETLRELKKEQKSLTEEIKKFKDNPEKMMQLQQQSLAKAGEMMKISMKSFSYTAIPIILFFRWFSDYFSTIKEPVKILGIFSSNSWLWAYIILSIIFSILFRKMFKLP